jgi:hypothetical protein
MESPSDFTKCPPAQSSKRKEFPAFAGLGLLENFLKLDHIDEWLRAYQLPMVEVT